jgi:hypothetical protein
VDPFNWDRFADEHPFGSTYRGNHLPMPSNGGFATSMDQRIMMKFEMMMTEATAMCAMKMMMRLYTTRKLGKYDWVL